MKLENNLSFDSMLQKYEGQYNHEQLYWLRRGYDNGLDISLYANPAFNSMQMHIIMYGLENGVDATLYAFVEYHNFMMQVIYHLLANGARFDKYVIEDHLDVDAIISDYDLLIKYKGYSRLSTQAINKIYVGAPYYTKERNTEIEE